MANKAFEFVGKKILLLRELDNVELQMLKYSPRNQLIEKIIETGVDEMCGVFQRSSPVRRTFDGRKGEIDFIEPVYTEGMINAGIIIDRCKRREPKGRLNPKNPTLRIHYGIDISVLQYCGENGLPTFRGSLWPNFVEDDIINDGHKYIFNKFVQSLNNAGFSAYLV